MRFSEQDFDASAYYSANNFPSLLISSSILAATQIHSSLLSISVGAVLIPVAYHFTLSGDAGGTTSDSQKHNLLKMSHGVSRRVNILRDDKILADMIYYIFRCLSSYCSVCARDISRMLSSLTIYCNEHSICLLYGLSTLVPHPLVPRCSEEQRSPGRQAPDGQSACIRLRNQISKQLC